ncbi:MULTISPECIES: hypothetical protein [unclassified Amycolatopsis]|uniref:hypothetical protein n=1 Tax=unclassified Amycolatopsis TaxID=2618356 RepID=UPI0012907EDE|nr:MULTISPECIES: hypothetical protein [unclassified Amycolatopsis]MBN6035093.1 hypothetical protein [Amycolatopsis sp. 195334CR]QFU85745.1 hypothetical protein YIM_02605 [Amycolatopsis sp. YIM 10]
MGNSSLADAAAFRNAAATGQVGVDPDAAQTVLNKIRTGKDAVEALLSGAGTLAEPPKLGANPVGQAIAAKVSDRAQGGGDSYATALQNLLYQYEQAEQGILAAMKHYQDFEHDTVNALNGRA